MIIILMLERLLNILLLSKFKKSRQTMFTFFVKNELKEI